MITLFDPQGVSPCKKASWRAQSQTVPMIVILAVRFSAGIDDFATEPRLGGAKKTDQRFRMLTLQTWIWPAIAIWVVASIACLPLPFLSEQEKEDPDVQSTINAAVLAVTAAQLTSESPTQPPSPTSTSTVVRPIPTPTIVVVATPSMTPVPTPRHRVWVSTEPDTRPYAAAFEGQPISGEYFESVGTIGAPTLLVFWAPW